MIRSVSTIAMICFLSLVCFAQQEHAGQLEFTQPGSSLLSLAGSLSHSSNDGSESSTEIAVGFSQLNFVSQSLFLGPDITLQFRSDGGRSATSLGIGPKVGVAFRIPESPLFPFAGFGYRLLANFGSSETTTMHIIRLGFGMIVEVVDHWGVPIEFTLGWGVGEEAPATIINISIGFAILGY